jgi:glycosyltransferase involved in cell wall biosynthesis
VAEFAAGPYLLGRQEDPVKIAQVAPLFESVPPQLYGGTERVVSYLTEELVAAGHEVTLFASGDSVTSARLVPVCERSLRLDKSCVDPIAHHVRAVEQVYRSAEHFDCVHFHLDYLHFPLSSRLGQPRLTTLHGRLDLPDLPPLYRTFPEEPLISISDAQRLPLGWANWKATIHHGLPGDLLHFHPEPGRYLAFLGRISPEKRPDRAIELARRVGMPLRMAAKVDNADKLYFEARIKPLLDTADVEFVGEINEREKDAFLGQATALLFPIDWPEPFGLVMIEAMACGTPVLAWRKGSVPEIIEQGNNGLIVESMEEAEAALRRIGGLDRKGCRAVFDARFSAARMAEQYVEAYDEISWAMRPRHSAAAF